MQLTKYKNRNKRHMTKAEDFYYKQIQLLTALSDLNLLMYILSKDFLRIV